MTALLKWVLAKHTASVVIPTAMAFSYWLATLVEGWDQRLIVMFGVGGIAGIILAVAKLKVANATARKIDVDTSASQWVLIVENLHSIIHAAQAEHKAISLRLEAAQRKEDLITFSKHEALKYNQALNFFVANVKELVGKHNGRNPECAIDLPPLTFIPLADILRAEDEARLKSGSITDKVTA